MAKDKTLEAEEYADYAERVISEAQYEGFDYKFYKNIWSPNLSKAETQQLRWLYIRECFDAAQLRQAPYFRQTLKELIQSRGMTIGEFCKDVGIDQTLWSQKTVEKLDDDGQPTGEYAKEWVFTLEISAKIATKYLDISCQQFLFEKNAPVVLPKRLAFIARQLDTGGVESRRVVKTLLATVDSMLKAEKVTNPPALTYRELVYSRFCELLLDNNMDPASALSPETYTYNGCSSFTRDRIRKSMNRRNIDISPTRIYLAAAENSGSAIDYFCVQNYAKLCALSYEYKGSQKLIESYAIKQLFKTYLDLSQDGQKEAYKLMRSGAIQVLASKR